jgi:acyl carrier protein
MSTRKEEVLARLIALSGKRFGRNPAELSGSDDFYEALGIDSMEALSLLTTLESELSIEVPDYEVQDCRTFSELAEVIARRLS